MKKGERGRKRDREKDRNSERKKEGNSRDKAVKIDYELAGKIQEFISRKENKIKYSSIKQFIDIAVLEKLESEAEINEEQIEEKGSLGKGEKPEELKREINYLIKKEVKVPSGII